MFRLVWVKLESSIIAVIGFAFNVPGKGCFTCLGVSGLTAPHLELSGALVLDRCCSLCLS